MGRWTRYAGLALEPAYGTATAPTWYLPMVADGLELVTDRHLVAPQRRSAATRVWGDRQWVAGTLEVLAGFDTLGSILRRTVGPAQSSTSLGGSPAAYAHTWRPGLGVDVASMTVDVVRDVDVHRYTGIVPTRCAFTTGLQDYLRTQMHLLGRAMALQGVAELPDVAESAFEAPIAVGLGDHATPVELSLTTATQGTWTGYFKQAQVALSWQRKLRHPERLVHPEGVIQHGHVACVAGFDWVYDAGTDALLQAWLDAEACSCVLSVRGALISGSNYELLRVTMPSTELHVQGPRIPGVGWGNIPVQIGQEGLWDEGSDYGPVEIYVVNQTTSYA